MNPVIGITIGILTSMASADDEASAMTRTQVLPTRPEKRETGMGLLLASDANGKSEGAAPETAVN
jgi:hypothetical protein